MGKKHITLLLAAMVVFLPSMSALAQTSARWEGIVSRSNKQKSTLHRAHQGLQQLNREGHSLRQLDAIHQPGARRQEDQ